MGDEPRKPLVTPPPAELRRQLAELQVDEELDPIGISPAEKRAASDYRPDPRYWDSTKDLKGNLDAKEKAMEVKPGWKTSELWLKVLAGAGIALLGYTITDGLPAIASAFQNAGMVGAVVALMVPVAKAALGWALHKLSDSYSSNRTDVKTSANDNTEAAKAA